MGQKVTPISLRTNYNYAIVGSEQSYARNLAIWGLFSNYFQKKGLIVNSLQVYVHSNAIYLQFSFFLSRNSKIYTKKYRKFLRKQSYGPRFNQTGKNLLHTVSKLAGAPKVFFKAERLDVQVKRKTLLNLISRAHKVGLHRYKKNKAIKDLVFALALLLDSKKVSAAAICQIIAKHFSWLPKRQHKRFLNFLKALFQVVLTQDSLQNKTLHGIKLSVAGRIAGKTQASSFQFVVGRVFTQNIDVIIDYDASVSYSKLGTYGWKLWITKK